MPNGVYLPRGGWIVPQDDRVPIDSVKVFSHQNSQKRDGKNNPSRIVLHCTEGVSRSPAAMRRAFRKHPNPPHLWMGVSELNSQKYKKGYHGSKVRTFKPGSGGFDKILQRLPLKFNARSLRHPRGTPETNYMGKVCAQVEIEGYAEDAHYWTEETLNKIGELVGKIAVYIRETHEPDFTVIPYANQGGIPGTYGVDGVARMTAKEWETGILRVINTRWTLCTHQNVPDNTHWDCGALDLLKISEVANNYLEGYFKHPAQQPPSIKINKPQTVEAETPAETPAVDIADQLLDLAEDAQQVSDKIAALEKQLR